MLDRFGRIISYLRVSVTDRCNLRCRYCMPEDGVKLLNHDDVLSFEDIADFVKAAAGMGITRVRLTGGEPLVRKGVVNLVSMVSNIDGITDLALTTNGILLANFAEDLACAGLSRVNISIDSMESARYKEITRGGDINAVIAGIDAAENAGLGPIKLNCVTGEHSKASDEISVKKFGARRGFEVRTIRMMDFASGSFSVVEGGTGGDCKCCNRLRLSSDGHIRPCLFSDISLDVRKLGAKEAIRQAVLQKPQSGGPCQHNWMHGIGG